MRVSDDNIINVPSRKIHDFRRMLVAWYPTGGRSFPWRYTNTSIYESIIAELLLQRTKAETVAGFFKKFINEFPSWEKIVDSDPNDLQIFLKPIGLWKRRELALRTISKEIVNRGGIFPQTRDEVDKLPGIGQYIGNAIMIFVNGENYPLLDANMARVIERCFHPRKLADIRYDPFLQNLAFKIVQDTDPKIINWAILDVGSIYCKISKPKCVDCPIISICTFSSS